MIARIAIYWLATSALFTIAWIVIARAIKNRTQY